MKNVHYKVVYGLSLVLFFLAACKPKQKAVAFQFADFGRGCNVTIQQPYRVISYDEQDTPNIQLKETDTSTYSGPIWLHFDFAKVELGSEMHHIAETKVLRIDKESDLLIFQEKFAFKFFHMVGDAYGFKKHYIRFDFLLKSGNQWKVLSNSGLSALDLNSNSNVRISTATGVKGAGDYFSYEFSFKASR